MVVAYMQLSKNQYSCIYRASPLFSPQSLIDKEFFNQTAYKTLDAPSRQKKKT